MLAVDAAAIFAVFACRTTNLPLFDARGHVPQRESSRANRPAFQLFPRARRGHRSAGFCPNGIHGRVRRAPAITAGIDENSPSAIHLVKFLSQVFRIPFDEERPNGMREVCRLLPCPPCRRAERRCGIPSSRRSSPSLEVQAHRADREAQALRRAASRHRRQTDPGRTHRCPGGARPARAMSIHGA